MCHVLFSYKKTRSYSCLLGTGSNPPLLKGLHLIILLIESKVPLKEP